MSCFSSGQVLGTRALFLAMGRMPAFSRWVQGCLARHLKGDWGDTCTHDAEVNDLALKEGSRIVSVYKVPKLLAGVPPGELSEDRIWIITEADRSCTTLLWPSDY
jgi:hypothetical protein